MNTIGKWLDRIARYFPWNVKKALASKDERIEYHRQQYNDKCTAETRLHSEIVSLQVERQRWMKLVGDATDSIARSIPLIEALTEALKASNDREQRRTLAELRRKRRAKASR